MSLVKYIVKRILVMIPVLFGSLAMGFFLSRMMPGDPVLAILAAQQLPRPSISQINAMRRLLGFNQPVIVQFFKYMADLFTGNWGTSISIVQNEPVWELIMQRLPRTIDITIMSVLIASIVGIKVGVISARHRNKLRDTSIRFIALVGVSIPVYFLGMLLQFSISYQLSNVLGVPTLPATGFKDMRFEDPAYVTGFRTIDAFISGEWYMISDYLIHLILPVFCLSFITLAGIARQTRSSMLEVLEQDYIRTARAKGCKEKDVINSHALKNSLIPTVTVIGLDFASLLGGAVLTESTFDLDGIGGLLIDCVRLIDYWVLTALIFVITLMFVIVVLITDLIYAFLDPRIRY